MSKNALAFTGQPFSIDSYNIHRLIIAGVMVSSKFFSDVFYTNTRYAKVGGLPVSELNSLELEFLILNDFNLTVPICELQRYGDQLLKVGIMEQEMRKSFIYETPAYTNGAGIRHGRSTSLGSNGPSADQRKSWDQSVDRLCDMATRISMDDNDLSRRVTTEGICGFQTNHTRASFNQVAYPSYGQGYGLPKVPSNGSLRSNVRRMASYGNLRQPRSPHHNRQCSDGSQQSPVALDAMDSDAISGRHSFQAAQYARVSSPSDNQHANRYSQDWSQQQPSPSSPSRPTRQRHGSMGLNNTTRPEGWQRVPRQSRSSINLYQQGGFWKPAPPSVMVDQQTPTTSSMRRLSLNAIYAPFIPYNEMLHANNTAYYSSAYHSHPAGIPTPPASSSPVHQKQGTPPPSVHQYPSSQQQPHPVMYL
ncbi:hypothetical protein EC973_005342 [Apophysomyces ossiformis]|uniref:Cyclin-domain-containing protein n=1 Tax=Apophysomyces ossiformis TaxID=679940 RepID=A0A8H7BPI7_9FUNG|nr:hypothetical protein EC973_005342 [Apophysomyces ossiformis]